MLIFTVLAIWCGLMISTVIVCEIIMELRK